MEIIYRAAVFIVPCAIGGGDNFLEPSNVLPNLRKRFVLLMASIVVVLVFVLVIVVIPVFVVLVVAAVAEPGFVGIFFRLLRK